MKRACFHTHGGAKSFKRVVGWSITNIIGIPLGNPTYKIQLGEDFIPNSAPKETKPASRRGLKK